ncbi:hypothetical protein IKP85_06080 [bacterium]|nr:hypothetical protein [bacterium]
MNGINNVSFQGQVPKREKRLNNIAAVIGGPLAAAGIVATYGMCNKELKCDSFKGTMKNYAKSFTGNCRDALAGLCQLIKQNKWADKVAQLKNTDKRIFAAGFLGYSLLLGASIKIGAEIGSKLRHRN